VKDGPFVPQGGRVLGLEAGLERRDRGRGRERRSEEAPDARRGEALIALGDGSFKAAARARARLPRHDRHDASGALPKNDMSAQELNAFVRDVASKQKERGKWDGPRGQVQETAWA
jgi:hypothetical protein